MGQIVVNGLVIPAQSYNMVLVMPSGNPYPILTAETLDFDATAQGETIHAIGQQTPIAVKSNATSYKGKLGLQTGEWNAILLLEGFTDATQVQGATISISAIGYVFVRTFKGAVFLSDTVSVRRGNKETLTNIDFEFVQLISA